MSIWMAIDKSGERIFFATRANARAAGYSRPTKLEGQDIIDAVFGKWLMS